MGGLTNDFISSGQKACAQFNTMPHFPQGKDEQVAKVRMQE